MPGRRSSSSLQTSKEESFVSISSFIPSLLSQAYLVHDGQQLTEGQTESPEGVAVFKLKGQAELQLWHQGALPISAPCLVPGKNIKP